MSSRFYKILLLSFAITAMVVSATCSQSITVRWDSDGTKSLTEDGWTLAGTTSDGLAKSRDYSNGQPDTGTNGVWHINDNNSPVNAYMRMYKDPSGIDRSQGIVMARVKAISGSNVGGTFGYSHAGGNQSAVLCVRAGAINWKTAQWGNLTPDPLSLDTTSDYRVYAIRWYLNGVFDVWYSLTNGWSPNPSDWVQAVSGGTVASGTSQSALIDETNTARSGLLMGSFGDSSQAWEGNIDYIAWSKNSDHQLPWNFNPEPPQDNAQYISDTIPTSMLRSHMYNVSVTMKNTGNTTWTAAGNYYLLGSGFADAFCGPVPKIALAVGDAIAPGQQKTFNFTMTAPSTINIYQVGWRMGKVDVPFGDICVTSIDVNMDGLAPDPPQVLTPADASLVGAPSALVKWQGDPHDACQIRIGSSPTSSDGWDSGVIAVPAESETKLRTTWSRPSDDLLPQHTYYVSARLHNPEGWGDWSVPQRFYVNGSFVTGITPTVDEQGRQSDHAICYNPDDNEYLLAYFDVPTSGMKVTYRILDPATGMMKQGTTEHSFSSDSLGLGGVRGPVVTYNNVLGEYLMVFSGWTGTDRVDLHDKIYGIRIAPGGTPKGVSGQPQLLGEVGWLYDASLAFSTAKPGETNPQNIYMLAWFNRSGSPQWIGDDRVHAMVITPSGESGLVVNANVNLSSEQPVNCWAPKVEYNPDMAEFFVAFEVDNSSIGRIGDIYGQRISTTGTLIGTNFPLVTETSWDLSTDLVYVPELQKFLMTYTGNNGVGSVWGQFLNGDGTYNGSRFIIQEATPISGWGQQVTWHANRQEFLVTWCSASEDFNYARRVSPTGAMLCDPFRFTGNITGGHGNFTPFPLANLASNDYMICWFYTYDTIYTRRYTPLEAPSNVFPPNPVIGFTAAPASGQMDLSWTNPLNGNFSATRIVCKAGGHPVNPSDGTTIYDGPGSSFVHSGLTNGTTYYYAAFAHDIDGRYTAAALAVATPWSTAWMDVDSSSFSSGTDGWNTSVWRSGTGDDGTVQWISDAGNPGGGMRSTGAGITDSYDACLREGGEISSVISTVGYSDILISYDLRVNNLGNDITGAPSGSCPVDHNLADEQLTVFYSTDGGTSWTQADWVRRADLVANYRGYATRQISLSGISACNNNPRFTLRFRWQFNTQTDTGDLDNIKVTAGSQPLLLAATISEAKGLADYQVRILAGNIVSARFPGFFYIQDLLNYNGIRVVSSAAVSKGQKVDVKGYITGAGAERYFVCSAEDVEIKDAGPIALNALGLTNFTLGGGEFNAYTPGVAGGAGLNNIGLLVKCWGRVYGINGTSFKISDGSGVDLTVQAPDAGSVPADGAYVSVTGIVSCDSSLQRVLLVSEGEDILTLLNP